MQTVDTEQSKLSIDHVISRFTNRTDRIKDIYEYSPTFREICTDYAEMATWIESYCQPEKQPSPECDYAQEVLEDLEAEIIECLEGNDKVVNNEYMRSKEL